MSLLICNKDNKDAENKTVTIDAGYAKKFVDFLDSLVEEMSKQQK